MAQAMGPRMRSVPKNKAFYGESQSAGASGTCALASAESTTTIAHAVVMRRDIVDDCTGTVLSVLGAFLQTTNSRTVHMFGLTWGIVKTKPVDNRR